MVAFVIYVKGEIKYIIIVHLQCITELAREFARNISAKR